MKKISLLIVLALAGCAPDAQRQLSAGRIGCPVQEIAVSDVDSSRHARTWSASCRGQNYYCSSTDDFLDVMCKPELKTAVTQAPSTAAVAPAAVDAPVETAAAPAATAAVTPDSAPTAGTDAAAPK